VTDAASTVQTAASATYTNMSETLQVHCQSVADRLLNYKYQDRSLMDTSPEYPDTLQPIWILGEKWSAKHDLDELRDIVQSRLWFTYRRDFPFIGSSELTTDQGWGCMLRCGQMLLGSCLQDLRLSRKWRWSSDSWKNDAYTDIIKKFQDKKSAPYSIHQISLMGESVEKKPVGTWFGPNTVVQVLRKLALMDPCNDLVIHVAMDNMLIVSEVKAASLNTEDGVTGSEWRPLLLCIPLRLGLTEINPVYIGGLKACLSLPQAQGVLGGSPNHALYILGFVEDEAIYLDPHVTQPYVEAEQWHTLAQITPLPSHEHKTTISDQVDQSVSCKDDEKSSLLTKTSDAASFLPAAARDDDSTLRPGFELSAGSDYVSQLELVEREDQTFHITRPGRLNFNLLDPSLTVTFLCKTEEEFDNLCIDLQEKLGGSETTPLFEMLLERPAHMFPQTSNCDISVQPDERTGEDYERIDRKYDSDDGFEII